MCIDFGFFVVTVFAPPSLFGSNWFYLSLDYFYTATPDWLPGGPNFSYAYYIFFAGTVGTAVTLVAAGIYQVIFSKLRFRPVLLITTLLVMVSGTNDLIMVKRWNLAMGISDNVAYMMGEAVFEPLVEMMNWIPVSALISIAVPKGNEASCFAFIAGISNFSRMVSELSGGIIFRTAGVITVPDPKHGIACNFEPLWYLLIVCQIVLPVIGIPAVWLIPNLRQTDTMEDVMEEEQGE